MSTVFPNLAKDQGSRRYFVKTVYTCLLVPNNHNISLVRDQHQDSAQLPLVNLRPMCNEGEIRTVGFVLLVCYAITSSFSIFGSVTKSLRLFACERFSFIKFSCLYEVV